MPFIMSTTPEMILRNALFEHLVANHEVMPYPDATRALVGGRPAPDRNYDFTDRLMSIANAGPWKTIGTVTVRLDGLLVDDRTGQPSPSHFSLHHSHAIESWKSVFGTWAICRHAFPAGVGGSPVPEDLTGEGT